MKFIVTRELGRLAKWLRILGYDTVYFAQDKPSSLLIEALRDNRTILSRNRRLPKSCGIRIVLINAENVQIQIKELFEALGLKPQAHLMFSRCILCNTELAEIEKSEVKDKVPEYVFTTQDNFVTCPTCQRIYWQGTHWGRVKDTLIGIGLG